jgi:hypothetical protein
MIRNRLVSLAAASVITVAQWTLCLAPFLYTQPVTGHASQLCGDICQSEMPEITCPATRYPIRLVSKTVGEHECP